MPKLRALDLRGCALIGDAGLEHVGKIKTLERVKLRCPSVSDRGFACVAALPKLKGIAAEDAQITDEAIKQPRSEKILMRST